VLDFGEAHTSADLVGSLADSIAGLCRAEPGDLCLAMRRLDGWPTSGSA
jgi:hypothetical protein